MQWSARDISPTSATGERDVDVGPAVFLARELISFGARAGAHATEEFPDAERKSDHVNRPPGPRVRRSAVHREISSASRRRVTVRTRWQFAHTTSHFAISAWSWIQLTLRVWLTPMRLVSPGR
jgi:hypothetical protein